MSPRSETDVMPARRTERQGCAKHAFLPPPIREHPLTKHPSSSAALVGALLLAVSGTAWAQVQSRGEMLYSTHCISCHTTAIHWRDKKVATDRASLKFQVRRWQGATGLGWSEGDIDDVTRYLNESIYRYPPSADPTTGNVLPPGGPPTKELATRGRTSPASGRVPVP